MHPPRATGDDSLVLESRVGDRRAARSGSPTSCRSATGAPDVVRIVEGVSGRVDRCAARCACASTTARSCPGCAAVGRRTGWPSPGPTRSGCAASPRCGPGARHRHHARRVHRRRRASGSPSSSPGTPRTSRAPDARRPVRGAGARASHDWRAWAAQCRYEGPYREAVIRSLITLKALTYAPTGGIVAAATTSLPEEIGGVRNWDYRYCWLRDATLTLGALLSQRLPRRGRGLARLAAARGRRRPGRPADHVRHRRRAAAPRVRAALAAPATRAPRPVRVGNAAVRPAPAGRVRRGHGLPVPGAACRACPPSRTAWQIQLRAARLPGVGTGGEPDEGLWEVRGPRRHFVHSKVMAWVAADRAVRTLEDDPTLTAATLERLAGDARRDPPRRVREGLRRRAQHLHPVVRLPRARRRAAAHPPRRLPAAGRPAGDRHGRRGPRGAGPRAGSSAATAPTGAPPSTGCRATRAPSWPARSGWRTPCS